MLLELETPLEFGDTVTAACLNSKPVDGIDADTSCISVGWFTEDGTEILIFFFHLKCIFQCKQIFPFYR